ncbi:hypothetical protein BGZ88_006465 [Linnemannia elongata]|nr:hypothetical protein BGZ88_006465 [Linnemannia elongata]
MQFSTLITLTVATSMAVLSAMAAPTGPKCGTVCPDVYQPVCAKAIDGLNKVFGNACELKNFNCKHPNANFVTVADSECKDIPAPTPVCNKVCAEIFKPVCAKLQSGKSQTFSNACEMDVFNCEHPNDKAQLVANAACPATPTPAPACNKVCPMNYAPVCAKIQSGETKTFGNTCELNVYKCEHPTEKVEVLSSAACAAN